MNTNAVVVRACKKTRRRAVLASLLSVALAYTPVGMALKFQELSDTQLADMRGKYVPSSGRVQYFGLTMTTKWKTPDFSHNVSSRMVMNLAKRTFTSTTSQGGSVGDKVENVAAPEPNAALAQISGNVQSIQVQGSGNSVQNEVGVNVVDANSYSPSSVASAVPAQSSPLADETYQTDKVTTHFNPGAQFGHTVTSGGSAISQSIGGINRQMLQSVVLQGNAHQVINSLKLDVAFKSGPLLNQSIRVHRGGGRDMN